VYTTLGGVFCSKVARLGRKFSNLAAKFAAAQANGGSHKVLAKFVRNETGSFTLTFPSSGYNFEDRVKRSYKSSMASKCCGAFPCP
jgi:hypothetical protein